MSDNEFLGLMKFRDALSDHFLRPQPVLAIRPREDHWRFVDVGLAQPLDTSFDVDDVEYAGYIEPLEPGVVGIGVGSPEGDPDPKLLVFAESESKQTKNLVARINKAGVPVTLKTGVEFIAAAARPVKGGQSMGIGSIGGASGTMGCVVKSRSSNDRYALSCNHVIAALNAATKGTTPVWAPGAAKSGTSKDRLGVILDYCTIDFTPGNYNVIDAAIAQPDDTSDLDSTVDRIGALRGTNLHLAFGDPLAKMGAESGHTSGKYRMSVNTLITYANGSKALFRDLLGIVGLSADFAAQGDSGAVVVDSTNAVAGQIISVTRGIDLTLATSIKPVLDYFGVDIV